MIYTYDITSDPNFLSTNLESIPYDCTELRVVGKLFQYHLHEMEFDYFGTGDDIDIFSDEFCYLNVTKLINKLKKLKQLQVLDFSRCTDITKIEGRLEYLSVKTIILPPFVTKTPSIFACYNLTTLIGKGLVEINQISLCPLLEDIEFNSELNHIYIPNTSIRKISLPNVTIIKHEAFKNCKNLVEIEFSSKLKKIEKNAFENCSLLYSVIIPDSCTTIEDSAFMGCLSLKKVYLSNKLETIYVDTFNGCISLSEVSGGKNVSLIEKGSFNNCKKLRRLPFIPHEIDEEAFGKTDWELYGVVMSTKVESIIWCFNNFTFYQCPVELEHSMLDKIVTFNSPSRANVIIGTGELSIEWYQYQMANSVSINSNFDHLPHELSEAINKLNTLPVELPTMEHIREEISENIHKLDINKIIDSYITYAHESQTWKVGGDNTFHRYIKSSIDYTDCYIESLLPNVNVVYHESAYYDYSKDIDKNIQEKYAYSDEQLKIKAKQFYNQEDHIRSLINHYLKTYISDKKFIEHTLRINFAKDVVKYFFFRIYTRLNISRSLSFLCDDAVPAINYEKWLQERSKL